MEAPPLTNSMGAKALEPHSGLFFKQTRKGCFQECLGCEAQTEFNIATMENKEVQTSPFLLGLFPLDTSTDTVLSRMTSCMQSRRRTAAFVSSAAASVPSTWCVPFSAPLARPHLVRTNLTRPPWSHLSIASDSYTAHRIFTRRTGTGPWWRAITGRFGVRMALASAAATRRWRRAIPKGGQQDRLWRRAIFVCRNTTCSARTAPWSTSCRSPRAAGGPASTAALKVARSPPSARTACLL